MSGAQLNGGNDGNSLVADRIKVGANVFLLSRSREETFAAAGVVSLAGAEITGQLNMSGAQLNGGKNGGDIAIAERIKVGANVLLRSASEQGAFTAAGTISLAGAEITGQLDMSGAQLNGGKNGGDSLIAERIKVGASALLRSASEQDAFTSAGTISLAGAEIPASSTCPGAQLNGGMDSRDSLIAERIKVHGDVLLRSASEQGAFTAAGAISLAGAEITGQLDICGAQLHGGKNGGDCPDRRDDQGGWRCFFSFYK